MPLYEKHLTRHNTLTTRQRLYCPTPDLHNNDAQGYEDYDEKKNK